MTFCHGCDERRWLLTRRQLYAAGLALPLLGLNLARSTRQTVAQDVATPTTAERLRFDGGNHDFVPNASFISPLVEIYGEFEIGRRSFIAANTILYAGEGQFLSLGDENNCQDNAYLLAIAPGTTFGNMVSIAHQGVIEDSLVGDFTFFGFRSRTRNCEIGAGSMIMHNTTVEGGVIPLNRITPFGVHITDQGDADALPEVTSGNDDFKRAVRGVNIEFAAGYTALYEEFGRSAVEGTSVNPVTSFPRSRSRRRSAMASSSPSWSASSAMSGSAPRVRSAIAPRSAPTKGHRSPSAAAPASAAGSPSTPSSTPVSSSVTTSASAMKR